MKVACAAADQKPNDSNAYASGAISLRKVAIIDN